MSTTLMPFSGPIRSLPIARAHMSLAISVQLRAAMRRAQGRPGYGRMRKPMRLLFLLAGFADLDETVEFVVLLVDAVGDARLVLLARGGRRLLDELADIVLEDRDAVVECIDGEGVFVVIAHDAHLANQSEP